MPAVTYQTLSGEESAESSAAIRKRILNCREVQTERFQGLEIRTNVQMRPREIKQFVKLGGESRQMLEAAMRELRFSARAYYKILKISRTIADLSRSEKIEPIHIAEAIQYRSLDRQW